MREIWLDYCHNEVKIAVKFYRDSDEISVSKLLNFKQHFEKFRTMEKFYNTYLCTDSSAEYLLAGWFTF